MPKLRFLFILFVTGCTGVFAQNDLTFFYMKDVFQSSYINPSSTPTSSVSIGVPVISAVGVNVSNSGFTYGDLYQKGYYRNDTIRGNINNAFSKLQDQNYFRGDVETDLFHIRVKMRRTSFALFSQVIAKSRFSYSKEFADLVLYGNADKLGRDLSYENLGFDFDMYRTIGIGITREWKNFDLGANVKFLNGISNFSIDPGKELKLKFDPGYYDFQVTSDVSSKSAGFDTTKPGNYSVEPDFTKFADLSSNPGLALDLGATYKGINRLKISFSVINLGFINWNTNVVNTNIAGGIDFKGFDVFGDYVRGGATSESSLTDEFENSFKYKVDHNSYRKNLIPQFYIGARYELTKKTSIGLLGNIEKYKKVRTAYSLSVQHQFSRIFSLYGSYNLQNMGYDNVGLGLAVKLGPVQIYAAGDNLGLPLAKTIASGFQITKETADPIKTFNLKAGLNLIFGRVSEPARQSSKIKK